MKLTSEELLGCLETFISRLFALSESDAVEVLLDLNLSFSQARALCVLAHVAEPVPISEIGRRLRLSQAAAGRNADRLVQLGIVQRHHCHEDRRVTLVSLTARGWEIADQHLASKRQAIRMVTERIPVEDCDRLIAALRPILAGDYLSASTRPNLSTSTRTKKEHAYGHR